MRRVNIPKNIDDLFYRYKRQELEIEKVNKKGGYYILKNLEKVSKDLSRPSKDILKYFRKKLGIPINQKGHMSVADLNVDLLENILEIYIEKHVLCKTCGNPETDYSTLRCLACGNGPI